MKTFLRPGIVDWPGLRARMLAIALDYDGTLVPIRQRPEEARPDRALLNLLQNLTEEAIVIILTGRNRGDMDRWISNDRITIVASHGAEWRHHGRWKPLVDIPRIEDRLETLSHKLEEAFEDTPGVIIENKGATVAFHYRLVNAVCQPELLNRFEDLVNHWREDNEGYEVLEGKYVREIRPAGLNKGTALQQVLTVMGFASASVLAMGDDRTDEDTFQSLGPQDLSILVGDENTSAVVRLNDVWEVREVLKEILRIRQKS